MKTATGLSLGAFVLIVLAAAVGAGFLAGRHMAGGAGKEGDDTPDTTQAAEAKPIATVQTAPLAKAVITETITAYGSVVPRPTDQQVISASVETKVSRLLVIADQQVAAGQAVAEVEPSPDTALQLVLAQNAVDGATRDLAATQERYNLKLAMTQELQASQNALRDVQVKLENMRKRGAGEKQTLKAAKEGVVAKVDVTPGQIVPAGNPLLEIDDQAQVEVRLGVQPADGPRLKIDQAVDLFPVSSATAEPIKAKIRMVSRRVNPDTRLVDVFVALPPDTPLLLGAFVRSSITVASEEGLVVPRSAVLPEDAGFALFTVQDGHAVKHGVTIGLQTDTQYEVTDEKHSLKAGDVVVIGGNYELDDGMQVNAGAAP